MIPIFTQENIADSFGNRKLSDSGKRFSNICCLIGQLKMRFQLKTKSTNVATKSSSQTSAKAYFLPL